MNLVLFYAWEMQKSGLLEIFPWNMHLSSLGPVSCFSPSWIPSGASLGWLPTRSWFVGPLEPESKMPNEEWSLESNTLCWLRWQVHSSPTLWRSTVRCLHSFFDLFRATPAAYGRSQARAWIRAVTPSLQHSHTTTRSKPCLRPTLQLTATLDP